MPRNPRVAVLVESTRAYGRGQLSGIASYLRQYGSWNVYWQERGLNDRPPVWLRGWDGDGIIARISTRPLARTIRQLALPTVDLYGWLRGTHWPCLRADNAQVVRLAVDHLRERGFQHLAYCGFSGVNYSDERFRLFQRRAREEGYTCHVCATPRLRHDGGIPASEQQGLLFEAELADWLLGLPKPIGILACNDVRGQQILNTCREMGVLVPDQVAVLGIDNDDIVCNLSDPPLSSVDLNCARMGFEAAALLARLLRGEDTSSRTLLVEPNGVVTRRSTDVLAIEDAEIARAVRLIRAHACSGLTVHDVLASCALSASSLERRFTRLLGRTPKAEIIRVRLQRVAELLGEPDLTLDTIAARTGFKHPEYLSTVFKKHFGMSLGQYRRRVFQSRILLDP